MVARSDLCRPWVLFTYGGMWLDLRSPPAGDPDGIGLETVPRWFGGQVPPLLLVYGGQWQAELNLPDPKYGEIMNGFSMSIIRHPVWPLVWAEAVDRVRSYPERWRRGAEAGKPGWDYTLRYIAKPIEMFGKNGVLCLGPLSMTKIVFAYLTSAGALAMCVPKKFAGHFNWQSVRTSKKTYAKIQGRLFYRDWEKARSHKHYQYKTSPIVT